MEFKRIIQISSLLFAVAAFAERPVAFAPFHTYGQGIEYPSKFYYRCPKLITPGTVDYDYALFMIHDLEESTAGQITVSQIVGDGKLQYPVNGVMKEFTFVHPSIRTSTKSGDAVIDLFDDKQSFIKAVPGTEKYLDYDYSKTSTHLLHVLHTFDAILRIPGQPAFRTMCMWYAAN